MSPTVAFATVTTAALAIVHDPRRIKTCHMLHYTALRMDLQENTSSKALVLLSLLKLCCSSAKLSFISCMGAPASGKTEPPARAQAKLPPSVEEKAVPAHLPISKQWDGYNLERMIQVSRWVCQNLLQEPLRVGKH